MPSIQASGDGRVRTIRLIVSATDAYRFSTACWVLTTLR